MSRQKRTVEQLQKETLKMITKLKEIDEEANKTKLANVMGINNTLITSVLNGLLSDRLIKKEGKEYVITDAGVGWLMIEKLGKEKAGLYFRYKEAKV